MPNHQFFNVVSDYIWIEFGLCLKEESNSQPLQENWEDSTRKKKKEVCDHILIVKRPGQEYHQAVPRIRVINALYQTTFHRQVGGLGLQLSSLRKEVEFKLFL